MTYILLAALWAISGILLMLWGRAIAKWGYLEVTPLSLEVFVWSSFLGLFGLMGIVALYILAKRERNL